MQSNQEAHFQRADSEMDLIYTQKIKVKRAFSCLQHIRYQGDRLFPQIKQIKKPKPNLFNTMLAQEQIRVT